MKNMHSISIFCQTLAFHLILSVKIKVSVPSYLEDFFQKIFALFRKV